MNECCPSLILGIINITQQEKITLSADFPPSSNYQNSIIQLICFLQKSLSPEFITVNQNCSKKYLPESVQDICAPNLDTSDA